MASVAFKAVQSFFENNVPILGTPITRRLEVAEREQITISVANNATTPIPLLTTGSERRYVVVTVDAQFGMYAVGADNTAVRVFSLEAGGTMTLMQCSNVAESGSGGYITFKNTSGAAANITFAVGGD